MAQRYSFSKREDHMGDAEWRRGYDAGRESARSGVTKLNALSVLAMNVDDACRDEYDDYDRGYALGFAEVLAQRALAGAVQ